MYQKSKFGISIFNLKPFNKHYIQIDELRNFMNYLKRKGDFETCLIFELLYKFGIRVGARLEP